MQIIRKGNLMDKVKKTFGHLLLSQVKKVLCNPFFVVAIVLQTIALLVVVYGYYISFGPERDQYLYLLDASICMGLGKVLIPILSVLPMVAVKESTGLNDYFTFIRTSRKNYLLSESIAAALSGFLVVGIACLLFVFILFLLGYRGVGIGFTDSSEMGGEYSEYATSCLAVYLDESKRFIILILRILIMALYGAVWPMLLLVISRFTVNKYVMLVGPFLINDIWGTLVVPLGVQIYLDPAWQMLFYSAELEILTFGRLIYEFAFHIVAVILFFIIYAAIFTYQNSKG